MRRTSCRTPSDTILPPGSCKTGLTSGRYRRRSDTPLPIQRSFTCTVSLTSSMRAEHLVRHGPVRSARSWSHYSPSLPSSRDVQDDLRLYTTRLRDNHLEILLATLLFCVLDKIAVIPALTLRQGITIHSRTTREYSSIPSRPMISLAPVSSWSATCRANASYSTWRASYCRCLP